MSVHYRSSYEKNFVLAVLCGFEFAGLGLCATWQSLANRAPAVGGNAVAGTMMLLTDGTVMVEGGDWKHWLLLTPDLTGSYQNGTWKTLQPMSTARHYFASQVLHSGEVWVFGGEYGGPGLPKTWIGTGEIYDPVANSWSNIAQFPNQTNCPKVTEFSATVAQGSSLLTLANVASTSGWAAGWTVTGPEIPSNTTITSIDSAVHLSQAITLPNGLGTTDTWVTVGPASAGSVSAGSTVIMGLSSAVTYQQGWLITGQGIPSGTRVANVTSPTSIQISQAATETVNVDALNFPFFVQPTFCFGDEPSILLPGGKILAGNITGQTTYIYGPDKTQGPQKRR